VRILVCGDIHCKPFILPKAVEATNWDIFVFLGDACDNFGATQEDNLEIIKQLADFKKKFGEKFVWLLGNHDWGYYDDTINMSGHILAGSSNVNYLLKEYRDLWDLFYMKDKFIFSHAGVSADFMPLTNSIPYKDLKEKTGANNPMNEVGYACGGTSTAPSLLWARPSEVISLATDNVQIVGHTPVECITKFRDDLIICDTFSQYPDQSYIGDLSLLLLEGELGHEWTMIAIDYETGRKLYEL